MKTPQSAFERLLNALHAGRPPKSKGEMRRPSRARHGAIGVSAKSAAEYLHEVRGEERAVARKRRDGIKSALFRPVQHAHHAGQRLCITKTLSKSVAALNAPLVTKAYVESRH